MRAKIFLTILAGLWVAQSASAQDTKHASELLPDTTVAYFEVQKIDQLAKEVGELLKKSALANVPFSLQKYMKLKAGQRIRFDDDFYGPALALSPEVLREVGKLGSVAGGMTGMVNDEMPEFAVIVDPGKSDVPKFFARMLFLMEGFGPARKVEGVTLWSEHGDNDPDEVMFAFLGKQIVLGTPKAVSDVVMCAKGKAKGKTLADTDAYRKARKETSGEPGIFACANVENLVAMFGKLVQKQQNKEREVLRAIGSLINPKAFPAFIYEATLKDGTLHYRQTAVLDPNEKSPLLDLLPTKAVDLNLAKYAPKNALMFTAYSNSEGAARFSKIIGVIDNLAVQLAPNDPPPSATVQKVEQQLGINIAKDVAGKIEGFAVVMHDPFAAGKQQVGPSSFASMFRVVVQASDAKAAKHLTGKILPDVFRLTNGGRPVQVDQKMVMGREIHTLSKGQGNSNVLYWALDGKNIVIGANGPELAKALNGAKTNGLLGDAKLAKRLKSLKQPIMIGTMKYFSFLMSMFSVAESTRWQADVRPKAEFKEKGCSENQEAAQAVQPREPAMVKVLRALAAKEQPLVYSFTRTKTRLSAQGELSGLRTFVPAMINVLVEMHFAEGGRRRFGAEERPRPSTQKTVPAPKER